MRTITCSTGGPPKEQDAKEKKWGGKKRTASRSGKNKLIFYLEQRFACTELATPLRRPPTAMHFVLPFYGHHQKRIKILLRRHAGGVDVKTERGVLFQGDCPGVLNIKSAQCQQHNNNINNIG